MDLHHEVVTKSPRSHPVTRSLITVSRIAFIAAAAAALVCLNAPASAIDLQQPRALALFDQGVGLQATLRGDTQPLPQAVVGCANCHARHASGPAREGSVRSVEGAPILSPSTLLLATSRRRGPPSAYDESSFCRLLAEGVDPAGVVTARTMPKYRISAEDCKALWNLLTTHDVGNSRTARRPA